MKRKQKPLPLAVCEPDRHVGPMVNDPPRFAERAVVQDTICEACGEWIVSVTYRNDAWESKTREVA